MILIHINEPKHDYKFELLKASIILKEKPDVICFEFPFIENYELSPSNFNQYDTFSKPPKLIEAYRQFCNKNLTKGSNKVMDSIAELWNMGKNKKLFEIDAPQELTSVWHVEDSKNNKGILNIAWNYLREKYMSQNIENLKYIAPQNSKVIILCHNYHWYNIKKIIKIKNIEQEIQIFFKEKTINEITDEVKIKSKILSKYWNLIVIRKKIPQTFKFN